MIGLGSDKNELQQIFPPTLSISDLHTSNEYITTNEINIYTNATLILRQKDKTER